MKLRNKKTGEILETARSSAVNKDKFRIYDELSDKYYNYNSLAELNEDWEDYEEPKEHYFIAEYGEVFSLNEYEGLNNVANPEDYKAIGNYFDSEEEAKKAVEKLKAWKRLKDKGFRFHEWYKPDGCEPFIVVETNINLDDVDNKNLQKDLDLLFGGEE